MVKERQALTWEGNNEEVRRLFTLTPDDLYFLRPLRVDSQRLYRALVLLWARVERVLLSETTSIPEGVIKQVSKQLGLSPALLFQERGGEAQLLTRLCDDPFGDACRLRE